MNNRYIVTMILGVLLLGTNLRAEDEAPHPIRALLILGGCCHDYATQKDLLKEGLEKRVFMNIDIIYSPDKSTAPPIEIYGDESYAEGYDLVLHDECAADIKDLDVVKGVLAPHRAGVPGVNLHCAMHSYRTAPNVNKAVDAGTGESLWFDYLGLQSSGHGPQKPIDVEYVAEEHPAVKGLKNWRTIREELYNNIVVRDGTVVLAQGKQDVGRKSKPNVKEAAVVWTSLYGEKKARVFSTSLGHNNETVGDDKYLDLIARGILWSCEKLDDDGEAAPGYDLSRD